MAVLQEIQALAPEHKSIAIQAGRSMVYWAASELFLRGGAEKLGRQEQMEGHTLRCFRTVVSCEIRLRAIKQAVGGCGINLINRYQRRMLEIGLQLLSYLKSNSVLRTGVITVSFNLEETSFFHEVISIHF